MSETIKEDGNNQPLNEKRVGSQVVCYVVLCSMSATGEVFRGDIVKKDQGKRWLNSELGKYDNRWLENIAT